MRKRENTGQLQLLLTSLSLHNDRQIDCHPAYHLEMPILSLSFQYYFYHYLSINFQTNGSYTHPTVQYHAMRIFYTPLMSLFLSRQFFKRKY